MGGHSIICMGRSGQSSSTIQDRAVPKSIKWTYSSGYLGVIRPKMTSISA